MIGFLSLVGPDFLNSICLRQVDDDGPVFFQILVWFEWVRSWVRTFCWICVSEGPTATKFALAESELYWHKIWRE